MSNFYDHVKERFIRYAQVDTQSQAGSPTAPSTMKQKNLAKMLKEELEAMGVSDVEMTETGLVYGTIPSTLPDGGGISIGFVAHMDTSPDAPGTGVKPWVYENYPGGDVLLNKEQNILMREEDYPTLKKYVGKDIIFTDGTTLLGADDKAGIAIILQAVEELLAEGKPHGKLCLGFTPDEEIGRGASNFDVAGFGADFAYTLDGGDITDYEYETFNAAMATVTVHGFSIHPGTAKDKMKNALLIAMEFNALLPALETPGRTDGYEGFFHLQEMSGKVEEARMVYIIRDHSMERFQERKAAFQKAAEEMNRRCGAGTVDAKVEDQYYNMYEVLKDRMEIVTLAEEAMKAAGIAQRLGVVIAD